MGRVTEKVQQVGGLKNAGGDFVCGESFERRAALSIGRHSSHHRSNEYWIISLFLALSLVSLQSGVNYCCPINACFISRRSGVAWLANGRLKWPQARSCSASPVQSESLGPQSSPHPRPLPRLCGPRLRSHPDPDSYQLYLGLVTTSFLCNS